MSRQQIAVIVIMVMLTVGMVIFYSQSNKPELVLATTTSVDNSGLLPYLLEHFYESHPDVTVAVIAKGTGAAIQLGADGEVDAILVHAAAAELEYMAAGYGVNRTTLWYNYFLLVGPTADPLNLQNTTSVYEAFQRIFDFAAAANVKFYSRGDNSGTNMRELAIWDHLNLTVQINNWYAETGAGMSSTLVTAAETSGYTLTDLGTYLQVTDNQNLDLIPVYQQQDDVLYNPYSYIVTNPDVYPTRNTRLAFEFLQFLQQSDDLVRAYRVHNVILFNPLGTSTGA